ncbi:hypothetical protein PseudUWO311_02150 [Pseudanabaena sp. UWO311]|uniref:hypothetical protein n=1 Tax=Pseudanabaena sp. UWO311 TaxID=2487337 RepID=UPI0011572627|nr:hypothetical protein [Pseudanabaena sp. UWO311]TYQ28967.1 hypothetical protein PseudUWO311_02150 [Pseudanabaena sp. UWO311]
MTLLRAFLIIATLIIYAVSIYVIATMGINYPAVFLSDMLKLDWRTQFNTDLLIALCLFFLWVAWREGFTAKGFLLGFLFMNLGFMFGCPYLLFATYKANGDIKVLLLGVHADK